MKKNSKISVSKGLTRIYFTLSAIWIIFLGASYLDMLEGYLNGPAPIMALFGLFVVFAPIPVWYILTRWFIAGFKK